MRMLSVSTTHALSSTHLLILSPAHEEYPLFSKEATETLSIVEKRPELPLSVYVGAARMPGTSSTCIQVELS